MTSGAVFTSSTAATSSGPNPARPVASATRVKRTYPEDSLICDRLVRIGFGTLSGAALRKAASEEYASAKAGEGVWGAIETSRRDLILSTLTAEKLMTYRKDFLGKYLSKTPFKTNGDMLLELKDQIVAERQWGSDPAALEEELARVEAIVADCPASDVFVYKTSKGERRYMQDGTQTASSSLSLSAYIDESAAACLATTELII